MLKEEKTQVVPDRATNRSLVGTTLASLSVKWQDNQQTLVLALSNSCHFCTESAPFYKRLAQNKGQTRIVAVLPQSLEDGRAYLERLRVSVDEIRQLPLNKIGVNGTPTLLLVDSSGVVKNSWIGKLASDQEGSVFDALHANQVKTAFLGSQELASNR